jgi:hypothetical protein
MRQLLKQWSGAKAGARRNWTGSWMLRVANVASSKAQWISALRSSKLKLQSSKQAPNLKPPGSKNRRKTGAFDPWSSELGSSLEL